MKKYAFNWRKCAETIAVTLTIVAANIMTYWLLTMWVFAKQ